MKSSLYIIMFFLISCCPKKDITIADSDKNWLPYVSGQTIIFYSDSIADTLKVIRHEILFDDDQHCPVQREKIEVDLISNKNDSLNFSIQLDRSSIDLSFEFGYLKFISSSWDYKDKKPSQFNNDTDYTVDHFETLTMNNKTYSQVLHIYHKTNNYGFYYAKGIGLIKYAYNGKEYILN